MIKLIWHEVLRKFYARSLTDWIEIFLGWVFVGVMAGGVAFFVGVVFWEGYYFWRPDNVVIVLKVSAAPPPITYIHGNITFGGTNEKPEYTFSCEGDTAYVGK